jgi:hypothetical protein
MITFLSSPPVITKDFDSSTSIQTMFYSWSLDYSLYTIFKLPSSPIRKISNIPLGNIQNNLSILALKLRSSLSQFIVLRQIAFY